MALLLVLPIRGSNFPLADLPGPPANPVSVPAGALIIPMDHGKQNLSGTPFNLAAYGLVNHLLQNKVPVYWVIRAGKPKDGVDFSARAERVLPTPQPEALLDFPGGPFVVPPEFADQALQLAQGFGRQVAVYRLKENRVLDVRYTLTFRPRILVHYDNSGIHTNLLVSAGFTTAHYTVATTSTTLNANSCFTIHTAPHTKTPLTGSDAFVQSGGNLMAQCQAVLWYENNFHFQISGSLVIDNVSNLLTYPNPDLHFSQFTGDLDPQPGGSEEDWRVVGTFVNNAHSHAQSVSSGVTRYAATASKHVSGPGGMVFYLGGHEYKENTLESFNGRRMFFNTIFVPASRPLNCGLLFGALRGAVFLDLNANGVWDAGEPPVPNITVAVNGPESATLTTNSQGLYGRGLDLGSYQVQVQVPGWAYVTTGNATQSLTLTPYTIAEASPVGLAYQASPVQGQVVINEVFFRQRSGDVDEFIEIYNAGNSPVDLSGFRLMDGNLIMGVLDGTGSITGSNTPFTFLQGTVLGPGEYLVVWVGASHAERQAPGAQYQFYLGQDQPRLNDSGDDLWLYDPQLRLVDYVAWGSFAENYYPRNLWNATYQASLANVQPGQSISLTPNGLDTNSSACWEPTTSNQAQNRCPGWLPTVDTDNVAGRVTSVGRNNNGFLVSGFVYHDLEPNGLRGPAEDWATGATVWVKLVQGGVVKAVVQVDPGTGAFQFQGVSPGSYTLLVDDNSSLADTTPTPPSGWLFVNPPTGSLSLTVSGNTTGLLFGLFHGAVVEGRVFWDDGLGGGTANDAWQDGGEAGVGNVEVRATDGTNTRLTLTDGTGYYRLYVPFSWGGVTLSHPVRPATGWNDGTTANPVDSWASAQSPASSGATVSLGSGSSIAGQTLTRNFGVVRESRFYPDASGQTSSPGTYTFAHWYRPGSLGQVTLSLNPPNPRYTYQVRVDGNCDGTFGPGEEWGPFPYTFSVGSTWPREPDGSLRACTVEVRALVPAGEPTGATDIALVKAELVWANRPGVVEPDTLTETLQVAGGEVRLEKRVRNVTQNTPFATTGQGRPGEVLEYCIAYRNLGTQGVSDFVLTDPVPYFTDSLLSVADYGGRAIRWAHGGNTSYLTAASDGDAGEVASGVVRVQVGVVGPGEMGEVCYRVRVR
ncbi:SdrD B-like domain-containing protein [Thermus caliditerrae]|uniref:SdrD B-like domain-containing protein n=1 Tax=Thermus caliditerrae TaxID=1330700 RepID=UPI001363DD6E|nr:lamin tail domain-containing protein [Thermus caliditerrae]